MAIMLASARRLAFTGTWRPCTTMSSNSMAIHDGSLPLAGITLSTCAITFAPSGMCPPSRSGTASITLPVMGSPGCAFPESTVVVSITGTTVPAGICCEKARGARQYGCRKQRDAPHVGLSLTNSRAGGRNAPASARRRQTCLVNLPGSCYYPTKQIRTCIENMGTLAGPLRMPCVVAGLYPRTQEVDTVERKKAAGFSRQLGVANCNSYFGDDGYGR